MNSENSSKRDKIIFSSFVLLFTGVNLYLLSTGNIKADWQGFGTIAAAGLTLSIYSFLYRDNPLFKITENLYVGVAAAYTLQQQWYEVFLKEIVQPLQSPHEQTNLWYYTKIIVPAVLGILMFFRLSKRFSWLSRISFAFMVGVTAGLAIPRFVKSYIMIQSYDTIAPVVEDGSSTLTWGSLVVIAAVVTVLFYFFFSVEHKGKAGIISKTGIYFLMVSFGASFGYTVMGRIALFLGRMRFLLKDWLGII